MSTRGASDSAFAHAPSDIRAFCRKVQDQYGDLPIEIRSFTKRASVWAGLEDKELLPLFSGMPKVELIPRFA